MFIHYRTLGLILKKEDRGETDQLFTVYTKDFGKLEILGKAIRKITSKLRSGADIFYLSGIEFIQGKAHKTLTDAILIENFKNLKKDLGRLKIAYKIAEVLDDLVKGEEKDEEIWQLILDTFKKLDNSLIFATNYFLIRYFFIWNLLSILGYEPEIYRCFACQKKLSPGKLYFSSSEGGVVCALCSKKIKKLKIVNDDFIKILRIILKRDWVTLKKLKFEKIQEKLLKDISEDYLSFVSGENKIS
jgi:DNA repair protein RecO (recombination protein O)